MEVMQQGATPLWEVFDVEDIPGFTSFGGTNRIKRVHFHVLGARDSYVDVDAKDFTAAGVAAAVETAVSHIIDVSQLKGQMY